MTTMGTCKTCRHWRQEASGHASEAVFHGRLKRCDAPQICYGYGLQDDDVSDNGAVVEDDEGWGMLTGPEFGCVLYG